MMFLFCSQGVKRRQAGQTRTFADFHSAWPEGERGAGGQAAGRAENCHGNENNIRRLSGVR